MKVTPQVAESLLKDLVIAEDGRVELPAAVLTWLGWEPGTELLIELTENGIQLTNWD